MVDCGGINAIASIGILGLNIHISVFGLERMTTLGGKSVYYSHLTIKEIVVLRVKWIAVGYMSVS